MSANFIPFGPVVSAPGASATPMQVRVIPQGAVAPLPPVLGSPHPAASGPQARSATPGANCTQRPVIKLEREGDRVTQIRIECACGQVIELGCVY